MWGASSSSLSSSPVLGFCAGEEGGRVGLIKAYQEWWINEGVSRMTGLYVEARDLQMDEDGGCAKPLEISGGAGLGWR